jgi:hypothetical protein
MWHRSYVDLLHHAKNVCSFFEVMQFYVVYMYSSSASLQTHFNYIDNQGKRM